MLRFAIFTFGVEGDEAITKGPFLHRLLQDDLLRKDDHINVVKLTKALQDLSHGLGFGFLCHRAYADHNLSLWGLVEQGRGQRRLSYRRQESVNPDNMSEWPGSVKMGFITFTVGQFTLSQQQSGQSRNKQLQFKVIPTIILSKKENVHYTSMYSEAM